MTDTTDARTKRTFRQHTSACFIKRPKVLATPQRKPDTWRDDIGRWNTTAEDLDDLAEHFGTRDLVKIYKTID